MARVSNETLAKTLSNTIFDLQQELKKDKKHREQVELEIRKQAQRIEESAKHFKPDLSDLNNSMGNYVAEIDKNAKDVKNSYITGKAIAIYFGTLILLMLSFYFFLQQQRNKTEEVQGERDYYKQFILESEERTADFKEWAK